MKNKKVLDICSDVCRKLNEPIMNTGVGSIFRCIYDGAEGFCSIEIETIPFLEMEEFSQMNEQDIKKEIEEHIFHHLEDLEKAVKIAKSLLRKKGEEYFH